jgi:hypothetical protein
MSAGKLLPTFRMAGVLVFSGSRNEKNKNSISKIVQDYQNWDPSCYDPTSVLHARLM